MNYMYFYLLFTAGLFDEAAADGATVHLALEGQALPDLGTSILGLNGSGGAADAELQ